MDNLIGGRYQIINNLGKGGFGETFLARDTHLPSQKLIVIKRLQQLNNRHKVPFEIITDLFNKEAKVLEDLGQHSSSIPTLYAYFVENERFYLVQEYIEGKPLADLGIICAQECRRILSSLLQTLQYIHSKKIIHRDIKPENIIIRNSDREPVLIDFGAVKETMGTIALNSDSMVSSVIVGTKGFMPPEQTTGRTVYNSDLFALGLTMIYSLTGKYPIQLKNNSWNGELEWQNDISNIDPGLQMVLEKATKIDLSKRYSTAEEMYQDLYLSAINTVAVIPSGKNLSLSQINESQINSSTATPTKVVSQEAAKINPQGNVNGGNTHKLNPLSSLSQSRQRNSYIQENNSNWFSILLTAIFVGVGVSIFFLVMEYIEDTQTKLAIIEQQKTETETRLEQEQQKRIQEENKRLQAEKLKREAELAREIELERIKIEQQTERDRQIGLLNEENSLTATIDNETDQNNSVEESNPNEQIEPEEEIISSSFQSQDAIAAVKGLYNSVSQKQYSEARSFFADPNQLDPNFFNQFTKVTVTNLKVTQENQQSVTLVGTNTYYYPDGTTQREKRDYTLKQIDNHPKITKSNFIKLIKSRS